MADQPSLEQAEKELKELQSRLREAEDEQLVRVAARNLQAAQRKKSRVAEMPSAPSKYGAQVCAAVLSNPQGSYAQSSNRPSPLTQDFMPA